jgi:TonB-dependent SusC/RagA subfamily outer membrane receptor
MLTSSLGFSGRASLALTVFMCILVGFVLGCARASEAEPEAAPQEEPPTASDLTSDEIQKRPREPVESMLESRFAGVRATKNADGSLSLRIRGVTSFYGNSEPLFVVDGVPRREGHGGRLAGISPYDIESIEVLKGPPETTLYGVRGANGVILITTVRPDQ